MKFTAAAVLAAAVGASANYSGNVTYVTEVVTALTTFCPAATQITHGGKTYTITEPTTLTITDCPCTVTKPVITTPVVSCTTCGIFTNSSAPATVPTVPTGGVTPAPIPSHVTGAAGKVAALSGAGLAAVVGLAAFL